jgi:hypothetical protein
VKATALIDIAGAQMGGAARYAEELRSYLERSARPDVQVLGGGRTVGPGWLLQRESPSYRAARRVAANNVSFVRPGGERWVLLRNALHFVTPGEAERLEPALRASVEREAAVVRLAARRADVLVVPSIAMAERVIRALPWAAARVTVRPHPVSATPGLPPPEAAVTAALGGPAIFCPVLFAPAGAGVAADSVVAAAGGFMLATVPDLGHPVRWLETAARTAALMPGAPAAASRSDRLGAYLDYLRLSRPRHTAAWWSAAAARAGLLTVPVPPDPGQPAPLRLRTFQRPPREGQRR